MLVYGKQFYVVLISVIRDFEVQYTLYLGARVISARTKKELVTLNKEYRFLNIFIKLKKIDNGCPLNGPMWARLDNL